LNACNEINKENINMRLLVKKSFNTNFVLEMQVFTFVLAIIT